MFDAADSALQIKVHTQIQGHERQCGLELEKKHGFKILPLVTRENICLRRLSFRKPIKKDTRSAIINQLSSLQSLEYVDLNLPFEKSVETGKGNRSCSLPDKQQVYTEEINRHNQELQACGWNGREWLCQ